MNRILLYGVLCALAPWLLARCRFLGAFTRPLLYLLALVQVSIVPVMVALDPGLSFGSDTYSLGAGIGMMLIGGIELIFVLGTAIGVLAAIASLNRRERAAAEHGG